MAQDQIPSAIASCTDKPIVEARFHLTEVHAFSPWSDFGYGLAKGVRVTMTAAKSGLFGKASPEGKLDLMIANPGAFEVFEEAFNRGAAEFYDPAVPSPKMATKRFRIYIVEDEDQTPA